MVNRNMRDYEMRFKSDYFKISFELKSSLDTPIIRVTANGVTLIVVLDESKSKGYYIKNLTPENAKKFKYVNKLRKYMKQNLKHIEFGIKYAIMEELCKTLSNMSRISFINEINKKN